MTPAKSLNSDIARIEALLATDPARARDEAAGLLVAAPGEPMLLLLRAIGCRLSGALEEAIGILESLCRSQPQAPLPHLQLGLALRAANRPEEALASLRRAVSVKPDFGDAWLALADLQIAGGDRDAADKAFVNYVQCSGRDPDIAAAVAALREDRLADAERLLGERLQRQPLDVAAICLLADVGARTDRIDDAERLLARCLELSPGYHAARHNYAVVLIRQNRLDAALAQCEQLLSAVPEDAGALGVKANILRRQGDYVGCGRIYEMLLARNHAQPRLWIDYGHVLRALGQRQGCIDAYRKAAELAPQFGEAWWCLANLKTLRFTPADMETMQAQLRRADLGWEDRTHLHFAAAKGLEDEGDFAAAFHHYAEGNRLRRSTIRYAAAEITALAERSMAVFTREFFQERAGWGSDAPDPIFIVGLPRVGSTLVEQILASHSCVEGTTELPDIPALVKSVAARTPAGGAPWPHILREMTRDEFRALGETYLEQTRVQRRLGRAYFIDKLPNNFLYTGFIHLMLPRARIIDVRRHPMACGLSLFKLLFGHGQHFAYSLEDIGRYYRDYAELMAHFDEVLPGRVFRVHYEALVRDTESEVRRLLDYCGLPFEEACLEFFRTERPVATPSSEQVRSPIYREGIDHWRNFEPWLQPLRAALGPRAADYPFT